MHLEDMLVGAEDAVNLRRCSVLVPGHRASKGACERNDFAVNVRIAFARDHRGAHVVNPDAAVFLPDVIVTGETDAVERLAHEFTAELLLNETTVERPGGFRSALRNCGRSIWGHPDFDFDVPVADEWLERLMRRSGRAGRLGLRHHLLHGGVEFLRVFTGQRQADRNEGRAEVSDAVFHRVVCLSVDVPSCFSDTTNERGGPGRIFCRAHAGIMTVTARQRQAAMTTRAPPH
jgi:hypothetical protein